MGVTLSRASIAGGYYYSEDNIEYYIGPSINTRIHKFIAISGGNYGIEELFID